MFAMVAASPFWAFATSAAADTHGTFLHAPVLGPVRGFCRFTTILPMVAGAVPVFFTVMKPFTEMKLCVVAPFVAVTVQVMVPSPVIDCESGVLASVQAVSFALQSALLQLTSVMLACCAAAGALNTASPASAIPVTIVVRTLIMMLSLLNSAFPTVGAALSRSHRHVQCSATSPSAG